MIGGIKKWLSWVNPCWRPRYQIYCPPLVFSNKYVFGCAAVCMHVCACMSVCSAVCVWESSVMCVLFNVCAQQYGCVFNNVRVLLTSVFSSVCMCVCSVWSMIYILQHRVGNRGIVSDQEGQNILVGNSAASGFNSSESGATPGSTDHNDVLIKHIWLTGGVRCESCFISIKPAATPASR